MKRKYKIAILVVCGMALLSTATYSIGREMNEKQQKNQKLERIENIKEKVKNEEEKMLRAKTDAAYDKIQNEMMKDLKEQTELEIQTGTYDYQEEFNCTLGTLDAGLATLNRNITDESKEWEKEKKKELQELYNKYSKYKASDEDYKTLSNELSTSLHEIIEKYQKCQ